MNSKNKKTLLLFGLAASLSACASIDSADAQAGAEEYVGWHCDGDINSKTNWRCRETALKSGVPLASKDDVNPSDNPPASAPKSSDTAVVAETVPASALESSASSVKPLDISADGYTVQLGAYLQQAVAEAAADRIIAADGVLRIRDLLSAERMVYVIVYGQYPTRQAAEVAAQELVTQNNNLNYWVRPIKSMRESN